MEAQEVILGRRSTLSRLRLERPFGASLRSLKPCGFNTSTTGKHPVFPTPFCGPGLLSDFNIKYTFKPMKKIIIYIDGGSRGNPGPAAIGALFCNEKGQMIKKYSQYLGENFTNNEAEYLACISALKKFKALFGKKLAKNSEIELRSDSELLVKQLRGQFKILDSKIQPLFLKAWNLKIDFKKVKFKLISREKNKEADRLVNEALNIRAKTQKLV